MSHHDTIEPASGQALLPCPHCGSDSVAWQADTDSVCYVRCKKCESAGPVETSPSACIAAWNRRQPDRLAQIETRLAAWFAAKYPEGVTDKELFVKFSEEVVEYIAVKGIWSLPETPALIEAADVCIVLFNTAARFGHSLGDAILDKLAIIERRLTDPNYGRGAK
jgi:Lar family restriction alleviation protein